MWIRWIRIRIRIRNTGSRITITIMPDYIVRLVTVSGVCLFRTRPVVERSVLASLTASLEPVGLSTLGYLSGRDNE
jgi:hypothetical protein